MSAQELRQAAETLRYPYRCNTPAYESALAELLDAQAEHVASHDCEAHCAYPYGSPQCVAALKVARAINEAAS